MPWYGWLILACVLGFFIVWPLCVASSKSDEQSKKAFDAHKRKEKEGNNGDTVPEAK